jgi:hypothetical protein
MKSEVYSCDGCGKQKQESNHWWRLRPYAQQRTPSLLIADVFILIPWDTTVVNAGDDTVEKHICSEPCASKALSKWMSAQRAETPVQRGTENVESPPFKTRESFWESI